MSWLRSYINRRSVRETLFFWFLAYLAIGAYLWPGGVNVPTVEARASFIRTLIYATLVCLPSYLLYRLARFCFIRTFPTMARRMNVVLHKS